jgi:hypothetical protein
MLQNNSLFRHSKWHVSQFYRLYLFRINRKNINDTICSNVDYHNILFAIMHQIVEKELPVQAKPAIVNNNSKRPCKHVYSLLCKSCFCCTSFVLDIDNTNIIKNVLLAERNKVTIHKTFMKRSKLETYGDFNGVMCNMRYGSSSSSLTVNSVQQQGSRGGNTASDQVRILHHVLRKILSSP